MKKNNKPIIIVEHRKKRHIYTPHGSWKIAYADFMTAMMAFFLVLALVGSSTPAQRQGVADYFRMPLSTALHGGNRFSDSESVIPGGGEDVTRIDGEERINELTETQLIDYNRRHPDTFKLLEVGKKIVDIIQLDPELKKFASNLIIELTEQGLRIQILSRDKQPMFAIGSAKVTPPMKEILHAIAPILNTLPNKITLSGHTDERKYPTGDRGYSNWELSGDRANASRRELVTGGLDSNKIIRITALADTVGLNNPKIGKDSDRRISILILNKEAKQAFNKEEMVTGIDLINKTKLPQTHSKTPSPEAAPSAVSSNPAPTLFENQRPVIIGLPGEK